MIKTDYTTKLQPLLKLGDCRRKRQWRDYAKPHGLTTADEPELLKMMQDEDLNSRKPKDHALWAPVHALRALAQVGTADCIAPLLEWLDSYAEDDDIFGEDIPRVLAALGEPALLAVEAFLKDTERAKWARIHLTGYYSSCQQRHPGLRTQLVKSAQTLLADFDRYDPEFNAFIVSELMHLRAVEALSTIRFAYLNNAVDEEICDEFDYVQEWLEHGKENRTYFNEL